MNCFDAKILNNTDWYIRKHAMTPENWLFTRLGNHPTKILQLATLQGDELPIVSSYINDKSWYLLTTRRVLGTYNGSAVNLPPTDLKIEWGNFKGHNDVHTELMTMTRNSEVVGQLEYETSKASMAPIYYFRFWDIRYPIIDKLFHNPYTNERS